MAGVSTTLTIQDKFSNTLNKAISGINRIEKAMEADKVSSLEATPAKLFRDAQSAINASKKELEQYVKKIDTANQKAKQQGDLWGSIKTAVMGSAAVMGAQKVLNLADSMTSTNARLSLMVDDGGSVEELNDKIFASAQRSRASYQSTADAISKMGIMARDTFGNNDELIAFTELINKQFTIAGTSTAGMDAAMLQLTQAMGSGILRGEELNSIFEQAPTIIQTIADYLGKPIGEIRGLAEEGKITSDVVKNAMLSSADKINEKFESMPMTYAQVWTSVQNMLLQTFQPLLQAIGRGAQWINDNWSILEPVFVGLAVAVGVYAMAMGIHNAVTWLGVAANRALIASMLSNPFLYIALLIGIVVGMIYKWVQSVGGLQNAWEICKAALLVAWNAIKVAFWATYNWFADIVAKLGFMWQSAGVSIANFMGDMKVKVLTILQNMINGAIDLINNFIGLLNKIPGVNIGLIEQVTFATTAAAENEAAKQAREDELANYQKKLDADKAARDANYANAKQDLADSTTALKGLYATSKQQAADQKANEAAGFDEMMGGIDSIGKVDEVGKINSDVNIADEDIKLLKDVAEMRYVQNFVTLQPSIAMSASVTKDADFDTFYNQFGERITEEAYATAEGYYG